MDKQKVAENTAEPFDHFTWDLSGYATSGQHILSVEAVDSFGLSKVSLGVPVTVTIVKPKFGLLPFLSRNSLWVALVCNPFRRGSVGCNPGRRADQAPLTPGVKRGSYIDPLTQPVAGLMGRRNLRSAVETSGQTAGCLPGAPER